jgi:hypothetical protein
MNTIYKTSLIILVASLTQLTAIKSQDNKTAPKDTAVANKNINENTELSKPAQTVFSGPDSIKLNKSKDTVHDKYGDLLNDDPLYNEKKSILFPIGGVIITNVLINIVDEFMLKLEFSKISMKSWNQNLKAGFPWGNTWWWDEDRFGNNFFLHPFTGDSYFNVARSNGYNFWESCPFVLGGSYMWKIFGENGKPEREDIINTTTEGIFLGEILYRVSSNILDDRTSGMERLGREVLAFVIDPARGFNRLFQGQTWRTTSNEVYQKEPLTIGISAGARIVNPGVTFATGKTNPIINFQLDYGDPFENRDRKPFDIFKFRTELNINSGRKVVDNLIGYGSLFATNRQYGDLEVLYGLFLNYDYWDKDEFELATFGVTAGAMTRWNISKKCNLYTKIHMGVAPFGGNSTNLNPDTSQYRDYNYGSGMEGQIESTLNIGQHLSLSAVDYFYWIHTYNAPQPEALASQGQGVAQYAQYPANGNNLTNIFRPRIGINVIGNFKLGFEEVIYYSDDYSKDFNTIHRKESEQKLYLTFSIEDFQQDKHAKDK